MVLCYLKIAYRNVINVYTSVPTASTFIQKEMVMLKYIERAVTMLLMIIVLTLFMLLTIGYKKGGIFFYRKFWKKFIKIIASRDAP